MNWLDISLGLVGGLALFLYAIARLSETLRAAAGPAMKRLLEKLTINPVVGLLTGCVVTIVLDSSSVTIILVIALVHAGAVNFEQSLGVILGSNIGTTFSSLLFATEVDRFSSLILVAGLLLIVTRRDDAWRRRGYSLFFVGLMLYGLHAMGAAMKPLADNDALANQMKGLEDPLRGVLVGAVATALIQSSSAMMGIIIKLASAGVMTLPAGVAVMLGAEIGTCLDTLVASAGRSRDAVRAGAFHLAFNVITVCIGLVFYRQIAAIATWMPGSSVSHAIANAHICFNTIGALLFLPAVPLCAKALKMLIPEEAAQFVPRAQSDVA